MNLLIGQPKDIYYFMRNQNGFPVTGMTSQTVVFCKYGGTPYTPAASPVEIGNGLYKIAASATDLNTYGPFFVVSEQGSFRGQSESQVVHNNPENIAHVNVAQISLSGVAADDLKNMFIGGGSPLPRLNLSEAILGHVWMSKTGKYGSYSHALHIDGQVYAQNAGDVVNLQNLTAGTSFKLP